MIHALDDLCDALFSDYGLQDLVAGFHKEDADDDHHDDDDDDDLYLHEACEKGWQPLKACCLPLGMMV